MRLPHAPGSGVGRGVGSGTGGGVGSGVGLGDGSAVGSDWQLSQHWHLTLSQSAVKFCKGTMVEQKESGIVPVNRLPAKYSSFKFGRLFNGGTGPDKKLDCKSKTSA
eukprot:scaffold2962_cov126-Cylindrotheca_fusiformis.AAC.20